MKINNNNEPLRLTHTMCHSNNSKNKIRVDDPGNGEEPREGKQFWRRVLNLVQQKIGREDEFRVSGGKEFQLEL